MAKAELRKDALFLYASNKGPHGTWSLVLVTCMLYVVLLYNVYNDLSLCNIILLVLDCFVSITLTLKHDITMSTETALL